jgi:hypothetical protein
LKKKIIYIDDRIGFFLNKKFHIDKRIKKNKEKKLVNKKLLKIINKNQLVEISQQKVKSIKNIMKNK